ncbi:hypothetical protein G7072_17700 [Nocardioides sp. HDW12B]|uniref:hypothetical protein n=1 Tax=Nocardioides sp. HDW12B TaxID=2714939 RepID=UPI00140BC892|nr:hypothetical protein [Nocardioides sp. HDW12B]QIK67930.1 hypothetical protein G7072_17700 [Nocardioides sp. HDW12B]
MSEDRPGSGVPAGGLSEEEVARLLGAAGPVEPTPPDVVSRLDAVLADLVAARTADGAATPAVSLDAERARRRRTWGARLLVAATVLGVAGVGLSVVDDLTGGSGSDSAAAGDAGGAQAESSEESAATESGAGSDQGQARRDAGGSGGSGAADDSGDADALDQPGRVSESARAPRLPRLLRISDDADLRAAVRGTAAGDLAALADRGSLDYLTGDEAPGAANRAGADRCVTPGGPGRRTLVSYRGDPATLVVRRTGDRLDGRVYDCELGLLLDGVEIGPAGE